MLERDLLAVMLRRVPFLPREGVACCGTFPHQARAFSTRFPASVLPTTIVSPRISSTAPHLRVLPPQFPISKATSFTAQHCYSTDKMAAPDASRFSKTTVSAGDGKNYPATGDQVLMEYTGYLYDSSKPDGRGEQFDSSVGRGDFQTQIGTGKVIKGWDQGVPQMSIGERATLIIPGDMAYGARGFPGIIPPNAALVFDVTLKHIHKK